MLVLSRKIGEEIQIAENITVKIVAIQGSRVLVGVQAPQEVRISRPETALANIGLRERVRRRQAQVA